MATQSQKSGGVSFLGLLFLLFLGLKLTNNIDWSWWWVTAPLWGPIAIGIVFTTLIILSILLISGVALLFGTKTEIKGTVKGFNNSINKK